MTVSRVACQSKSARLVQSELCTRGVAFRLTCASELLVGASATVIKPDGFLRFMQGILEMRQCMAARFTRASALLGAFSTISRYLESASSFLPVEKYTSLAVIRFVYRQMRSSLEPCCRLKGLLIPRRCRLWQTFPPATIFGTVFSSFSRYARNAPMTFGAPEVAKMLPLAPSSHRGKSPRFGAIPFPQNQHQVWIGSVMTMNRPTCEIPSRGFFALSLRLD